MAVDEDRLNEFLGRFVGDLGATIAAGSVVIGHRLGLYRALAEGPATPAELARRTRPTRATSPSGCAARPPAATSPTTRRRATLLADRGAGLRAGQPGRRRSTRPARSCWRSARCRPSRGSPRRSAPAPAWAGTSTTRTSSSAASSSSGPATSPTWCRAGSRRSTASRPSCGPAARVADIGCGLGASTILLAEAYPHARLAGSDYHDGSIELARKRAADAGVADRVELRGRLGADLLRHRLRPGRRRSTACTTWATRSARPGTSAQALAPDGTWLIVEPVAGDDRRRTT